MKTVYHRAESRGHADHGWLNTYHTFSFANYYDPERIGFGVLRVINDDTIQGGTGFGKHPHKDMEIVTIPLKGSLKHGDDMGNEGVIRKGEVQVMSAGTGVVHSEVNADEKEDVQVLQIWLLSKKKNVEPRYDQIVIEKSAEKNLFKQILSSNKDDEGVWVHQDAWFYLANFEKGISKKYTLNKKENGVYIFIIEGEIKIADQVLKKRDGYGISEASSFDLEACEDSEILIMEVPMVGSE